jgi:hypothetical protein
MPSYPITEPNDFELQGKDIVIHYSMESFVGGPQLTYKTQKLDRQFQGEEIRLLETEIGKLVTVTIERRPQNPDVKGELVTLTLLLPMVDLPEGSIENSIETKAVLTTDLVPGNMYRPFVGQLQTYEVLSLTGTARLVDF